MSVTSTGRRQSQPFAFILPLNALGRDSLKLKSNRRRLASPFQSRKFLSAGDGNSNTKHIAKLDFAFVFGRRCVSFGHSRAAEFKLAQAPASPLSESNFLLQLDAVTGKLRIIDTSHDGTLIKCRTEQAFRLLHDDSFSLEEDLDIVTSGAEFRIILSDMLRHQTPAFNLLMNEYLASINETPISVSPISTVGPMQRPQGRGRGSITAEVLQALPSIGHQVADFMKRRLSVDWYPAAKRLCSVSCV